MRRVPDAYLRDVGATPGRSGHSRALAAGRTALRCRSRLAELLDIEHESPQVILLRRGRPLYDASHRLVSAAGLERELVRVRAA